MTASMARLGWRLLDISQRHRLSSLSVVCGAKRHFSTPRPSSFSRSNNSDEGFVRQSPLEDVVVPNVTLDKYIWRDINKWANHTAVVRHTKIIYIFVCLCAAFILTTTKNKTKNWNKIFFISSTAEMVYQFKIILGSVFSSASTMIVIKCSAYLSNRCRTSTLHECQLHRTKSIFDHPLAVEQKWIPK